jgi:sugar-specific transcriptional regulator TrmB
VVINSIFGGIDMIVQQDFLEKLRRLFKLNIYEVKIWTALLSRGVATAGELSDIANVPRSRSYDVLETLEKKGFVVMKLGKPIKYIAVPPEEIVYRVQKKAQQKAKDHIGLLGDIKDTDLFSELELLHKNGINHIDPTELAGAIKGRASVYAHLKTMLDKAQSSVTIITTENGLARKAKSLLASLKKLKRKGVKITVYAPLSEKNKQAASQFKDVATIHHITKVTSRAVVIDRKKLLIFLLDDKDLHENYDSGIWVESPYFASFFEDFIKH